MFKKFFNFALKALYKVNKAIRVVRDESVNTIVYSGIALIITNVLYKIFTKAAAACA